MILYIYIYIGFCQFIYIYVYIQYIGFCQFLEITALWFAWLQTSQRQICFLGVLFYLPICKNIPCRLWNLVSANCLVQCICYLSSVYLSTQLPGCWEGTVLPDSPQLVYADVLVQVLREVLSGGGTVLMVAHNLKSVETADQIIFIENGEVMEEGTHSELMAKRGCYHHFYQNCNILQSRTAIWYWMFSKWTTIDEAMTHYCPVSHYEVGF